MQPSRQNAPLKGFPAAELAKNGEAISRLARSGDAQKLMALLRQRGGAQEAAEAAAAGDTGALTALMDQLMKTKEGAELINRIGEQAKKAGLE